MSITKGTSHSPTGHYPVIYISIKETDENLERGSNPADLAPDPALARKDKNSDYA